MPVRQWRLQEATLGLEPSIEDLQDAAQAAETNDPTKPGAWPELPMPRGSNTYAPWCQQILRAARAGRTQKRKRDNEVDDDRDNEANDEHVQSDISKQGFSVRRWAQVPRQMENTEPEYLAERRKGLPREQPGFINGMANGVVDAVVVEAPEEPVRRRMPPPPRKKSKKGRKKKLAFTDGEGVSAAAEDEEDKPNSNGTVADGTKADEGDDDGDEEDDDDEDADDTEAAAKGGLESTDTGAITMPSLAEVPSAVPSKPATAALDKPAPETLPSASASEEPVVTALSASETLPTSSTQADHDVKMEQPSHERSVTESEPVVDSVDAKAMPSEPQLGADKSQQAEETPVSGAPQSENEPPENAKQLETPAAPPPEE